MRDIILVRLTHLHSIPTSIDDPLAVIAASAIQEDGTFDLALAAQQVRSLAAKNEAEEKVNEEDGHHDERKCIIS